MRPTRVSRHISLSKERAQTLTARLIRSQTTRLIAKRCDLESLSRQLESVSYKSVVSRGFALVRGEDGAIGSQGGQLVVGQRHQCQRLPLCLEHRGQGRDALPQPTRGLVDHDAVQAGGHALRPQAAHEGLLARVVCAQRVVAAVVREQRARAVGEGLAVVVVPEVHLQPASGRNCGSAMSPPSEVSKVANSTFTRCPIATAPGSTPTSCATRRVPSSSSTSATGLG